MKLFMSIFLVISVSYGQLRTPQSVWTSLEKVSPLNDKSYFDVMDSHAKKLSTISKNKTLKPKKYSSLKILGLKSTLRSYANGNKFYIPERVQYRDSFAESLDRALPGYIPPTQSETEVMKFFGDKMIQNWLSSDAVKKSSFGKAASTVEKAMKVEATLTSAPTTPGGKVIDHKFSFQYLALQDEAKMNYTGWTHVEVRHDPKISQTSIELSERLFNNKDFVINHAKNLLENKSSFGVRWSW